MSTHLDARAAWRLRALRRYVMAVEAGRLDDIADVLVQSEADPVLGRLLDELHAALAETADDGARTVQAEAQPSAVPIPHPPSTDNHADTEPGVLIFYSDDTPIRPPAQSSRPGRRGGRLASVLQSFAAVLVLGGLLGGFFALNQARMGTSSGPSNGHATVIRSGLAPNAAVGVLAAGTWDGAVVALRPSDGKLYWRFESGTGHPVTNVIVHNQVVYANTEYGDLYALRMSDGALIWQRSLNQFEGYLAQFSLTSSAVLVTSADGVHALRASDGTPLWTSTRAPLLGVAGDMVFVGTMQLGPAFPGSSVSNVGVGTIEALRASDGKVIWTQPTKNAQDDASWGAVSNGTLFVSFTGPDNLIEAFRVADGHPLWTRPDTSGAMFFQGLAADQDRVYVMGTRTCALALADGATLWCANSSQAGAAVLAVGVVCLASYGSNATSSVLGAVGLRAADGTTAWRWNPTGLAAPPGRNSRGNNPSGISVGGYNLSLTAGGNTVYFALYGGAYALRASDGHLLWHAQPHDNYMSLVFGS